MEPLQQKEWSQEDSCVFISSRGFLKACHLHSATPQSGQRQLVQYTSVSDSTVRADGGILSMYVCNTALPTFVQHTLAGIRQPFVLVSGDCDELVPDDVFPLDVESQRRPLYDKLLNHPYLKHWYCQNFVDVQAVEETERKITNLPIGLDYHTFATVQHMPKKTPWQQEQIVMQIAANAASAYDRGHAVLRAIQQRASDPTAVHPLAALHMCYSNHHFLTTTRFGQDRLESMKQIPSSLVFYEPHHIPREYSWIRQSQYPFVISPHGNGLDCHRTWEALALGCIPIVKRSPIDKLYEDLPVLIVKEWSDVTLELLLSTLTTFKDKLFNLDKITLQYWKLKFRGIE
jgi:hypothetical protein